MLGYQIYTTNRLCVENYAEFLLHDVLIFSHATLYVFSMLMSGQQLIHSLF